MQPNRQLNLQPPRIFLSYAKEDTSKVENIHRKLLREQLSPWIDFKDLRPGQNWNDAILNAIRTARFVLVFLSSHSITKRGYVQKEIGEALDSADKMPSGEVFIIPIRLDQCEIPNRLRQLHCIDMFRKGAFTKLVTAIRANLETDGTRPTENRQSNVPTAAEISDQILLSTLSFGRGFLSLKLPDGRTAISNGHFLSFRNKLSPVFKDAKHQFPADIELTSAIISKALPARRLYRKASNLLQRIGISPDIKSAYVLISKRNKRMGIYRPYMHYIQLNHPNAKIYLPEERNPIVVEENNKICFVVMPMRLSDQELRSA